MMMVWQNEMRLARAGFFSLSSELRLHSIIFSIGRSLYYYHISLWVLLCLMVVHRREISLIRHLDYMSWHQILKKANQVQTIFSVTHSIERARDMGSELAELSHHQIKVSCFYWLLCDLSIFSQVYFENMICNLKSALRSRNGLNCASIYHAIDQPIHYLH